MARMNNSIALAAVLLLGGCSFVSGMVFPSPSDEGPQAASAKAAATKSPPRRPQPIPQPAPQLQLGTSTSESPSIVPRHPTRTGVDRKISEMRRELASLEDEVNRTMVRIDWRLNELSEEINRQSAYVSNSRKNLTRGLPAVENGEILGSSLANRGHDVQPDQRHPNYAGRPTAAQTGQRRPLVVIRFDRPNVNYEQPLYYAVSLALQLRPAASFDVVAVVPDEGSTAQSTRAANTASKNAEQVLGALMSMGLPAKRLTLSGITSNEAQTNEVRIYVH